MRDVNELREKLAKEEVTALEAEREKSTLADRLKVSEMTDTLMMCCVSVSTVQCVESAVSTEQSRHAEQLQAANQHFQVVTNTHT